MLIESTNINETYLAEMTSTEGWKLFQAMLEGKYKTELRSLVTGTDETQLDMVKRKARCKVIKEILQEARINKEELNWMI